MNELSYLFKDILDNYQDAYKCNKKTNNPYFNHLRNEIKRLFNPIVEKFDCRIKLSGEGNMSKSPNLAILAPKHQVKYGIYPIFHFNFSDKTVTLELGDSWKNSPSKDFVTSLAKRAAELLPSFFLKNDDGYPMKRYAASFITDDFLKKDLYNILDVYKKLLMEFHPEIYDFLISKNVRSDSIAELKSSKGMNFWIISPGENAVMWESWIEEGIISIGWDELGNLAKYSRKEINSKLQKQTNNQLTCVDFVNGISIGDVIIAKKGINTYLGYGVVSSDYKFDNSRHEHKNIRHIDWKTEKELKSKYPLPRKTLTKIIDEKHLKQIIRDLAIPKAFFAHTQPKNEEVLGITQYDDLHDDEGYNEGNQKLRYHLKRERNPNLVKQAKKRFKRIHGKLFCQNCSFSFEDTYPDHGKDFIEVHHKNPISEMKPNEKTKIKDLIMLCSNCHRMTHRGLPLQLKYATNL